MKAFLIDNPEGHVIDRYAIVRVIRRQVVHSDDTGADVAVLRVAAIEFLPGDVIGVDPDATVSHPITAAEFMQRLRSDRMGDNPLDFDSAAAAESLAELRDRVHTWANESEVPPEELADEIRKVVPNIPDGVDVLRDARVLGEFLAVIREREDDAFDAAVKTAGKTDVKGGGKRARKPAADLEDDGQVETPDGAPSEL